MTKCDFCTREAVGVIAYDASVIRTCGCASVSGLPPGATVRALTENRTTVNILRDGACTVMGLAAHGDGGDDD